MLAQRTRSPLAALACPVVLAALLGAVSAPILAHHSFSMFDRTRTVTLRGTVRQLQWTNPHCFLQVLVEDPSGPQEWSIEMNSPLGMYRVGWRPRTFQSGDKVTVTFNPMKDGGLGGALVSAISPSGRVLGTTSAQP
jgi:hypothetical protein